MFPCLSTNARQQSLRQKNFRADMVDSSSISLCRSFTEPSKQKKKSFHHFLCVIELSNSSKLNQTFPIKPSINHFFPEVQRHFKSRISKKLSIKTTTQMLHKRHFVPLKKSSPHNLLPKPFLHTSSQSANDHRDIKLLTP